MKRFILSITAAVYLFGSSELITVSHDNDTYLSADIQEVCTTAGEQYGICPELIMSIIEHESSGLSDVISSAGCVGLMQINPKWHEERMERLGVTDLFDIEGNILVGVDYLADLAAEYGDLYLVLMTYNMGPEKAQELWNQGEYSDYALSVSARSVQLERARGK